MEWVPHTDTVWAGPDGRSWAAESPKLLPRPAHLLTYPRGGYPPGARAQIPAIHPPGGYSRSPGGLIPLIYPPGGFSPRTSSRLLLLYPSGR